MTYSEKLRDPRWQKKRLEVFQRDGFSCRCCGSITETLNVHHKRYTGNPWDAPLDDLETLCEGCHKNRTEFDELSRALSTNDALMLMAAFNSLLQGPGFPGYLVDQFELEQRSTVHGV